MTDRLRGAAVLMTLAALALGAREASPAAAPAAAPAEIVLYASEAPVRVGNWSVVADAGAAGGYRIYNPDQGTPKIVTALASPSSYFEMSFYASSGTPYHLWIRGRADRDHYANDSVHVQFSGSVTASGAAAWRIGTTSSAVVVIESGDGVGLSGWGWEDNGWNGLGSHIYFASTGWQKIRVQQREDGISIDQIVLSPSAFLTSAPGAQKRDATILAESDGTSSAAFRLKIVSYNLHHGIGTDNVYNHKRQAALLAAQSADVIALCEVRSFNSSDTDTLALRIATEMSLRTGVTWYVHFIRDNPSKAEGNAILSKWPIVARGGLYFRDDTGYSDPVVKDSGMSVAQATVDVSGRRINVFSTHLYWVDIGTTGTYGQRLRLAEIDALKRFAAKFAEPRFIAGDFNAQPSTSEYAEMTEAGAYHDAWKIALSLGTASSYPDNPPNLNVRTRRSKLDYVFVSRGASTATVRSGEVPDQRDLSNTNVVLKLGTSDDKGVRPSDHNLISGTFDVR